MRIDARVRLLGLAVAVVLFGNAAPERATAQSTLDAAQASEFLGHWLVNFQNAQGSLAVEIEIADDQGKVAATVTTAPTGTNKVTDIALSEGTLTLRYEADAQGQVLPILLELERNGENLDVFLEIGLGQTAEGIGTRVQR